MPLTARQIADMVQGELVGDAEQTIDDAMPAEDAGPQHVTFLNDARLPQQWESCRAGVILVGTEVTLNSQRTLIRVADPKQALVQVATALRPLRARTKQGICSSASIADSAQIADDAAIGENAVIDEQAVIGPGCEIGPGCYIGPNCRLGEQVVLGPNVTLLDDTVVGNRCVIHSNAVLGAEGFGYDPQPDGTLQKIPQLGYVEISDDVEIGAGVTIDRGTFGATRVGRGTKIDNQVQIGHNCQLGENNILVSQVGIAGSCKTGNGTIMAGQAGLADHVVLGDEVRIGAQAGVHADVPSGSAVIGTPAGPAKETFKAMSAFLYLPELRRKVRELMKRVARLEEKDGTTDEP